MCAISTHIFADSAKKDKDKNTLGPNDFPELINTDIPGAPKLGKPQLIMGETKPVISEGMGWAAPAVYDWNKDGKKDLIIGEFGSGSENKGLAVGHFLRVYNNEGEDNAPKFSDIFSYGRGASADDIHDVTSATPLSVDTW